MAPQSINCECDGSYAFPVQVASGMDGVVGCLAVPPWRGAAEYQLDIRKETVNITGLKPWNG
jgi:hypothetical protein